ncbi:MAG TPA: TetR/AcrR family transcriptional regulator [Firmicutes bacterium]|nr:TetR/AcrR family transcriptional regulator [Bacillota bacterium]
MAADMKAAIAEAALKLLQEKQTKKLTVKDIVEKCHITRQAFYYHFEDIPDLFQWMLERGTERMLEECRNREDPEEALRYFFLVGINAGTHLKRGIESGYGREIGQLMIQYVYRFMEQLSEEAGLYQDCSRFRQKLLLRYHSEAVMGLLREWTEEDTKNLSQIVHEVYQIMAGAALPGAEKAV